MKVLLSGVLIEILAWISLRDTLVGIRTTVRLQISYEPPSLWQISV